MRAPGGNYAHEFSFAERPVFGGVSWTATHKPCGDEVEHNGTYGDVEALARYGHDDCPAYSVP